MFQFESNYKKFGYQQLNSENVELANGLTLRSYIRVLFIPKGYSLSIDFKTYETTSPTLFFINSNQYLNILECGSKSAHLLFYNRDFYCVQIHDAEVACDGLLFNNIFQIPKTELSKIQIENVQNIFDTIGTELNFGDDHSEEMVRIRLKELIIHATRLWKEQNLASNKEHDANAEAELFRNFGRMVEIHFREKHSVADYADLIGISPKTLSNKFNKLNFENPNEYIKNRILLEAKRLLIYTDLSVKQISYNLGYEDPAYFNRLFAQKIKVSPAVFRKNYL
ncbi:helix-turn-helix domain-containing protein [Empedobacter sedimenti]|uniref:helix-turn-helix domain-containing protein n=1 Tax=Empedobacter sedimenti TaxID=3042610 RepID=UPI0024A737A8|nr:AraC family transcriptional regulator [Empedobacter sedimenti]